MNKKIKTTSLKAVVGNKNANSMVQWVALILFFIILMVFLMNFATAIDTIEGQRSVAKHALDSYLEENAIRIYTEVKQNSDFTDTLFEEEFAERFIEQSGLVEKDGKYVYETEGNGILYYITKPTLQFEEQYSAKLIMSYTLTVPVHFGELGTVWVDLDMNIISRFNPKFLKGI